MLKKLQVIFTRKRQENDVNDELRFHLEHEIEQNMAKGMSPAEARRRALIAFGGVVQTRESLREVHGGWRLESFAQDFRYGWRMLRKSPAFTVVAVLTLALGIGANTAIFSLIDAVMFRSMPIVDPQHLVFLEWHAHESPTVRGYWSFGECDEHDQQKGNPSGCSLPLPFFKDLQKRSPVFSHVAAMTGNEQLDLSGNGPARIVQSEFVSGGFFETLGLHAHIGRLFNESDDALDAAPVIVLNYGFWQSAFGGSASTIGKTIRLNGVPHTIIGVTEPGFDALTLANKYELWVPLAKHSSLVKRGPIRDQMDSWWLVVIGRVKPELPVTQAQAAVSLMFRNEMTKGDKPIFKPEHEPRIKLASAAKELGGTQQESLQPLYVMMLCVGVVLLIACANVAGLLLARSTSRYREMAVRLALGAKRGRLVLQMLTESLLLSVAGGALGLLMAVWGARALMVMVRSANPFNPPRFSPQVDWRVLAFTAGVSIFTGLVFGLAPALRGSDISLTSSLKSGDGGLSSAAHGGHRRFTLGGSLVAVQMALAIVVLVTAGLLVRTLSNLKSLNPGFDTHNVLLFGIDPRMAGYKGPQIDNLLRDLQDKFSAMPGVTSASYSWIPLLSGGLNVSNFHRPGTPPDSKDEISADSLPVGPKFFSTLHVPLLSGRDFTRTDFTVAAGNTGDKPNSVPTPAIVNQAFVQSYFPDRNPIGERFGDSVSTEANEPPEPGYVIVGVAGNAKYNRLRREIHPTFYTPQAGGSVFFQLRTSVDPLTLVPTVTKLVTGENEDLALSRISTQTQAIDRQVSTERITAQLASFFGLLALVLACLGLYGLLSYEVSRRTREIGIRMAVGARSHNVVKLVLMKAIGLIAGGAIAGIAVSLGVTRLLNSVLFGVKAGDPTTLVAVTVLLAVVALTACYIPARRATRVDPLVALRYE